MAIFSTAIDPNFFQFFHRRKFRFLQSALPSAPWGLPFLLLLFAILFLEIAIFLFTHGEHSTVHCWEFREDATDLSFERREPVNDLEAVFRRSRILRRYFDIPYHDAEALIADNRWWEREGRIQPLPYLHHETFMDSPDATLRHRLSDSRVLQSKLSHALVPHGYRQKFVCMHCLETDGFYSDPTERLMHHWWEGSTNFIEGLSGWDNPGWANRDRSHLYKDSLFSPGWSFDFFVRDTALYDTYADSFEALEPELQSALLRVADATRESFLDLWRLTTYPFRLVFRVVTYSPPRPPSSAGAVSDSAITSASDDSDVTA